jgi:uncharacterized protein involved in exopolysaccharide biosynthesis
LIPEQPYPLSAATLGPPMAYQPSFRDILMTFLKRKTLFALTCGSICLAGGGYLLLKQPLYLSDASLVLHFDSQSVPDIDRMLTPSQLQGSNEHREILYSDADILRSHDLIRDVVDRLGVARLYPRIAAEQESDARKLDLAIQSFTSDLVVTVALQSDVLTLSFLNPDAATARDAVQGLLDAFFAQEATVYANPQLRFAEDEAGNARNKLSAAQNALADFKSRHQIADLPQQVSQLLLQRTDVESRLNVAQGRLQEAEQRQDALKQLLVSVPANVSSSAFGEQFHTADDAESRLDQLQAKRNQLATTYRPGSPVFDQLDAQIQSLSAAARARTGEARSRSASQPNIVYENIKTDYLRSAAEATSAREPIQVVGNQLAQINARLTDLEAQRNPYDDLTRAVQIQNDTYRTLAIRYETARVEANRNAQKISAAVVIAAPVAALQPARPRRKLVALATAVAALVSGIGSVLAMEAFDDRLRTPRDVRRMLNLPVLAAFTRDA